jgi:glycosyltransferase involved in cell wall biosynthesis
MRVGIFIGELQNPKRGGASTFQQSILSELKKSNSQHQFYVFYLGESGIFQDSDTVKFVHVDLHKKFLFNKTKKRKLLLNREVLENKIEFLWFATPSYYFVETPFALTVWDLEHRNQTYFPEVSLSGQDFDQREKFYKNAIPKASYVIIGNDEGARQVNEFYDFPKERIRTIPMPTPQFVYEGTGDDKILSSNDLKKEEYVFYPAQFWPHKNHIRILKAVKLLKSQGINLKVAFSGSDKGNRKYIAEKVRELGLENEVKFLGFVSQSELISLYQNAFATTFVSALGPDNIPPLEAMALGCPVICADAPGMKIQLGNSALFFNRWDENNLAEQIKLLMSDHNLRKSLISSGNELANSVNVTNYLKQFLKLVDEFAPIRECWSNEEKYIHL